MNDVDTARVAELAKLPPTVALTFRGMPAGVEPMSAMTMTSKLVRTSRDPRVATDNFAHTMLFAIIARKARDVSNSAEHPEEAELVLLPGTVLNPIGQIRVTSMGSTAQILEEVDPSVGKFASAGMPESVDELIDMVVTQVSKARRMDPVELTSPGRYAGTID
jgi:hypothetical protein